MEMGLGRSFFRRELRGHTDLCVLELAKIVLGGSRMYLRGSYF